MFDKLIESKAAGSDMKSRRSYFLVSSIVVGIFFTTAVVISIFAADFGLGSSSFELTELLAPVEMAAVEPETPQTRPPGTSQSQVPTRQVIMARIDEPPTAIPTTASVVPNAHLSRPYGDVQLGKYDTPLDSGSGRDTTATKAGMPGLAVSPPAIEDTTDPEPPPVKVTKPAKKPPVQTLGVVNGKASYLPKPVYSSAAIAVHAQGKVDVQVMIDESGRVISANAVSGHPLLRAPAEQAARNAKFTTTYLSNVPVKVTGVIVYNFTR